MVNVNEPQFYPPRRQNLLVRLVQSISSPAAHLLYHLDLKVDPEDLAKLKAIEHERIVLLPNHSTFDDAIVLFRLSARWGTLFYYLVARDAFQGILSKFLPMMGGYSIQRGVGDRASIAQTLKLLQKPEVKLTIFPEGGCSFQNDTVMPFRTGAIQIPFQAMSKLVKDQEKIPNFYLVPISIKYHYQEDMTSEIDRSLQRLERELDVQPIANDFYKRLLTVGEKMVLRLEKEYGFSSPDTDDWNERFRQLKSHVLQQCEAKLNIKPNPQLPDRERVYKIESELEEQASAWTEDQQELYQDIQKSAFRLLNFDAMYYGYVADCPTPERYLDTLTRLERAIFDINQPKPKAYRKVYLRVGDPVNLKDHYQSYRNNKNETIEQLTTKLQQQVQENLDWLNRKYVVCYD
jgi:1-acyl-sn-glycerol-3-phosphate acyltransferase